MQVDIDSHIYQSLQFILSTMQGDIEYIDIYQCLISVKQGDIEYTSMKLMIYKLNFSNASWHRQSNIPKFTIFPISNARWHRIIRLQAQIQQCKVT